MEHSAFGLAGVIVLGIFAQWLAWRFNLPSILLMLLAGFLVGPVTGLLDPDHVLGEAQFPFVSIAVAIILFEGGLSLKLSDLRPVRNVVVNLVSIGALVTWILAAVAAIYLLGLNTQLAMLFGAILVVSGPTVIIPLLLQIRPIGKVGSVIKWEGIVNDPVGAVLAVLVFEAIRVGDIQEASNHVLFGLTNTVLIGSAFGVFGALILIILLRNYWVPDILQNAVTVMTVVGVHAASNGFQEESGLVTVTLMGVIMANQRYVDIKHIIEFKENLRVLLIAMLFIILAARLRLEDLQYINFNGLLFLLVLIFIVRPAAVALSTIRSELSMNERLFLAWMAPRGIVAAAVSSIFAVQLSQNGMAGAEQLAPLTFLVIVGTVAIYGLTAVPVGRWLKVAQPNPQGAIIAGAHDWARKIGQVLQGEGYDILMIDTNQTKIDAARQAELPTLNANIASDYLLDEIELVGIGRLLALTSNDEVNSLAALHFREIFGRAEIYQLPTRAVKGAEAFSRPLQGRLLFDRKMNYPELNSRFEDGGQIEKVTLTEEFDYQCFHEFYGDQAWPLFLITETGALLIFTTEQILVPMPGQILIFLVDASLVGMLDQAKKQEYHLTPLLPETTELVDGMGSVQNN